MVSLARNLRANPARPSQGKTVAHIALKQRFGSGSCSDARGHRARVNASQIPPPIMKPPEMRDTNRVRFAEKIVRTRPASSA